MRRPLDIFSVVMILIGFILLNQENNLGWMFIVIGVLKWAIGK